MRKSYRVLSALITVGLAFQTTYTGFAFSHASHALNNFALHDYQDFSNDLQNLIDEHDKDEYIDTIEMQINSPKMIVNGVAKSIDSAGTKAEIISGSTMIPARALSETLGCTVDWDGEARVVEIKGKEKNLDIPLDQNHIVVNGEKKEIPAAATIVNDRTLVPARALSEGLDCEVEWDDASQTVTITKDFQTKRLVVAVNDDSVNFKEYNPLKVLTSPDNAYVILQFKTVAEAKKAYEKLKSNSSVKSVEPDLVYFDVELSGKGNSFTDTWDTDYTQIVNYANTVNASRKMKIAVIDSGVKDVGILKGKVEKGESAIDGGDGRTDKLGHGTAVAGVIAKCMGNVDFTIYPARITNTAEFNFTVSQFGTEILHCAAYGADVINMSIGSPKEESAFLDSVISRAIDNNTVIVVSAGNDGWEGAEYGLFSSRNDLVVVGATNRQGKRADFSTYGRTVDLMAPGEAVQSLSTSGDLKYVDGTSFSSPHVAAAAALIKAKNSSMSPASVEAELKRNVHTPENWNTAMFGTGILCFGTPQQPIQQEVIIASNITVQKGSTATIAVKDGQGNPVDASSCAFSSDNKGVAEVSNAGVVTAKSAGVAKITIKKDTLTTTITVTVSDNTVDKTVTAYKWADNIGSTINLQPSGGTKVSVYAVYSDGSTEDVTAHASLKSSNTGIVTVTGDGSVKAIASGEANILFEHAALNGISVPRPIKVKVSANAEVTPTPETQVTLTGYEWSTDTATRLEVGESDNIKVFAVYSDGTKKDVTRESGLYSTDTSVVTVDASGKIKAIGNGDAKIAINVAALNGNISMPRPFSIVVTGVELVGFEWSKNSLPTLEVGDTDTIKVYSVYSDGSKNDVTQSSGLISSNERVVTIDKKGKVKAVGAGEAKIILSSAAVAAAISIPRPITVKVNAAPVAETTPAPTPAPDNGNAGGEADSLFVYSQTSGGIEITEYKGDDRYLTIPGTIDGQTVVAIGKKAFQSNKKISSVSIPSSVKEIGDYAFAKCKSLKSVQIPGSVSEIGKHVFDECTSLTGVQLPSSISEISDYMFRGCTGLKRITIPSSVRSIGESAFANCRSLDITIPSSVSDIASSAFTSGNSIRISGSAGSAAESYATEKGFSFN